MSIESRLRELEQALAARRPPRVIKVQPIVVYSRAEVEALNAFDMAHPQPPEPPVPGRVELELLPAISAREYLRAHGIELPATETQTQEA